MLSEGFYRVCRAPECEFGSLGLGLVVEGDQESPCLFCAALAHPFRSEGGVEYARLPLVGASSDTSGELFRVSSSGGPCPIQ